MKKVIALVVGVLMAVCLFAACGGDSATGDANTGAEASSAPAESSSAPAEEPSAPAEESTEASGDAAAGSKGKIGLLPMTLDNEYYILQKNGAEAACERLGYELVCQSGTSHSDLAAQLSIMETMIESGVKGIIANPVSNEGIVEAIKKANAADIPVILVDATVDNFKDYDVEVLTFLGSDNYEGGVVGGEYCLSIAEQSDETLNVVVLEGVPGATYSELRTQGFKETVGDKVNIVASQSANSDFNEGADVMTNIITANPDGIDFVFSCNDLMAMGAYSSLQAAGITDVVICGFDGVSDALISIQKGELTASVAQVPGEMGRIGVEMIDAYLKGETPEQTTITPVTLVDSANVDDFAETYVNPFLD
ncbi:MAG: sugar ABC transporter substrate-binding protein [Christensenellaceae bacterium]|jgi:ribose transport system substrate-binding protein